MIRQAIAALTYGDLLMLLKNQTKPYEVTPGESDALVDSWTSQLTKLFQQGKAFSQREVREYFQKIAQSFADIKRRDVEKIKVGVVGEIYVKYSPLANNNLEQFLFEQDCEVMVPGILSFMIFKVDNRLEDIRLYGGSQAKKQVCTLLKWYFTKYETDLIAAVKQFPQFTAPAPTTPPEGAGREGHRLRLQNGRGVAAHRRGHGAGGERLRQRGVRPALWLPAQPHCGQGHDPQGEEPLPPRPTLCPLTTTPAPPR